MASCVTDTDSIDLTIIGGSLNADLALSAATPNPIAINADGVQVLGGNGWIPLPSTLTFVSGTGPFVIGASTDLRPFVSPGTRLKFTQAGIERNFYVSSVTASNVTVFGANGAVAVGAPITLPYFSPNESAGFPNDGPFIVSDGALETVALFYDAGVGYWASQPQDSVTIAGATNMATSSATYVIAPSIDISTRWQPYRPYTTKGLRLQARWIALIVFAVSESAFGMALGTQGYNTGIGGTGAQDTTNIFAELTTFAAGTSATLDSGWVDINPLVTVRDVVAVLPLLKSDGTRTVIVEASPPGLRVMTRWAL